nr:Zgc:77424 [Danio rerio]
MEAGQEPESARSAAQRRAEIRRRKLLNNSEDRMNRIVGFSKSDADSGERAGVGVLHLDLDHPEWSSSKRASPADSGVCESVSERGVESAAVRSLSADGERSASPRRGLQAYLSRFDDAMKLRGQLANEKAAQDSGAQPEELDAFRIFRTTASVTLAVFVRIFVCQYLSIFAPFLTLELGFMGLHKYTQANTDTHTYLHRCIQLCTHTHTHTHMHIHLQTYTYTHKQTQIHTHTCTDAYSYAHTHTHTHTQIRTDELIDTQIWTQTHTHTHTHCG